MDPQLSNFKLATIRYKLVGLAISITCFFSCASQPSTTNQSKQENVIFSKLGRNLSTIENESKTHILYYQNQEGDQAARQYKYAVVTKSKNTIVLEGSFKLGYVKWISDNSIEVLSLPSLSVQDEASHKKVFFIKTEQL